MPGPAEVQRFAIRADDGTGVACYCWIRGEPRGVVQIAHGGAEHALRYQRFAEHLIEGGFAVYAEDHRGHGATAGEPGKLGDMGEANAFVAVCTDITRLAERIAAEHPDRPIVLFGHSIGSLLAQRVLIESGARYAAAVLSGTPSVDVLARALPDLRKAVDAGGRSAPGDELQAAMFGAFLADFPDARTPFDWLSRDEAEVDRYVADPLCGFALRSGAWLDIAEGAALTVDPSAVARVPRGLPIHVISGERDPVHEGGRAIRGLVERYERAGLARVDERSWPGGRHELLNETNREEVTAAILGWLESVLAGPQP